MLEPYHKVERTSNDAASLDITKSTADASSNSHKNLPVNQISFQKQFISNQLFPQYQYPAVHLNPNQPQIDHYGSQSNILDSKRILCSQNTLFGSLGFTRMASKTIDSPHISLTENSLDSMVNNLCNILSIQQNLASNLPTKAAPSMFQSKKEADGCLPGIFTISTNLLNQDLKQNVHGNARMLGGSTDETRNPKEHSHFSGNTGSASIQGSTCMKDGALQLHPESPKRGCYDSSHGVEPRPKRQKSDTLRLVSWSRVVDGSFQRLTRLFFLLNCSHSTVKMVPV
jgi:hypothetical protein